MNATASEEYPKNSEADSIRNRRDLSDHADLDSMYRSRFGLVPRSW